MKSLILRTASHYLLPLLLLFSLFILFRGHYLPGGGFLGGLVAATALVLHYFAYGMADAKALLVYHPGALLPFGLSLSFIAAIVPLFFGEPLMTGIWYPNPAPVIGMLGTALLFDLGVYFVVVGVTLLIIFTLAETSADTWN